MPVGQFRPSRASSYVSVVQVLKMLWETEKWIVKSNFSFCHSVFYPYGEISIIYMKFEIVICKLLSVWKSPELVILERVKKVVKYTKLRQTVPLVGMPFDLSIIKILIKNG